jgi:hypothetical protein
MGFFINPLKQKKTQHFTITNFSCSVLLRKQSLFTAAIIRKPQTQNAAY